MIRGKMKDNAKWVKDKGEGEKGGKMEDKGEREEQWTKVKDNAEGEAEGER